MRTIFAHFFQAAGLYVEKSIIHRETEELLELDIITTDFSNDNIDKKLIEIKSGLWSFNEIFKVKGWLVYLEMDDGVFIVQNSRPSIDYFKRKALGLNIDLIDNSDLTKTNENLSKYLNKSIDTKEVECLRFAYLLERKLLKNVKIAKKNYPDKLSFQYLDDYFFKINSGTFFSPNPVKRIYQLFESYITYKNITAKTCYEINHGRYNNDINSLSSNCYNQVFYKADNTILQAALYIEHLARLTILKSCVEYLINDSERENRKDNYASKIDFLSLPSTIKSGLGKIVKEPFFHRYPIFWQWFTFIMGGFILQDFEDIEYQYLADNTDISIEEIPNAFDCFNKLFPRSDGWFFSLSKSNIDWHNFFPLPFSGIGANHRRFLHSDSEDTYEILSKKVKGEKTMADLIKWNNLAYKILSS